MRGVGLVHSTGVGALVAQLSSSIPLSYGIEMKMRGMVLGWGVWCPESTKVIYPKKVQMYRRRNPRVSC